MKKVNLFLDSGAYSAFSKNVAINLQDYIDFIRRYAKYIDVYANLDDINDPKKTWENQREMEKQGLKPLPVYHVGEDHKYLEMAMQYDYFAIGGMALKSSAVRLESFDYIFALICPASNNFLPTRKIHGFGMTSLDLMLRYPWWSVDSTSWVLTGRFGSVYVPRKRQGKYDYLQNPWKINVSNRSPKTSEEGQHYETFSLMEKQIIFDYFKDKGFEMGESQLRHEDPKIYKLKENERWYGKELADAQREYVEMGMGYMAIHGWTEDGIVEKIIVPGLCNDYKQRDELNIIYFLDLEDHMPKWPWPFRIKKMEGFGFKG